MKNRLILVNETASLFCKKFLRARSLSRVADAGGVSREALVGQLIVKNPKREFGVLFCKKVS